MCCGRVCESYGYEQYSAPLLEPLSLYQSKSSEEIVGEQVYRFIDRGEREVAIRPEMTPTLARMVGARAMQLVRPMRWYSIENFMRYERPGKGRLREFYQLNADLMGSVTPAADAEMLGLLCDLLCGFGAGEKDFTIRVSDRRIFDSFVVHPDREVKRAIGRLLDKREKIGEAAFDEELGKVADKTLFARVQDFLKITLKDLSALAEKGEIETSVASHLDAIFHLLETEGKSGFFQFDPGVVRGFDYYTGLIFEAQDNHPDNRRAICGGGRYDKLLGMFGKQDIPAVGFGLGDVTLEQFIRTRNFLPDAVEKSGCYWILFPETSAESLRIADALRKQGAACRDVSRQRKTWKAV
jgi:histidyl-tRNA synthetase